ncbi:hypothetical protein HNQ94_000473 [Salirhabdus euzebyi]|uniref:Uncharacterized protein n=1 Tax=Salirhabdus euzebyi TaxID=394506 RepID=A0A841Q1M8_9BACI|nr:hypothetical protein [Salirhabdus euzebyi]
MISLVPFMGMGLFYFYKNHFNLSNKGGNTHEGTFRGTETRGFK